MFQIENTLWDFPTFNKVFFQILSPQKEFDVIQAFLLIIKVKYFLT